MRLLVSALETSSNLHLTTLVKALPCSVELVGIYDKNLGNPIVDLSANAIMGFVDAIKKLPFFLRLKSQMVELSKTCDKVLLMDSSGFNLPLAKAIKKANPQIEIIYYILPQAWAWKQKRVYTLEKYCDTLLSIIPFESSIYPNPSKVTYVGHPLLDQIPTTHNALVHTNIIAFMPGSRKNEIRSLMPVFRELSGFFEHKRCILIIPPKFDDTTISHTYGDLSNFEISRNTYETLTRSEYAFICSGTATLEAALIGTPFTLCYRAKTIDYFIGKSFVKLQYIGLANIFFHHMQKEKLHDEFLQSEVTSTNLMKSYTTCDKEMFLNKCATLRNYLQHGSADVVGKIVCRKTLTRG